MFNSEYMEDFEIDEPDENPLLRKYGRNAASDQLWVEEGLNNPSQAKRKRKIQEKYFQNIKDPGYQNLIKNITPKVITPVNTDTSRKLIFEINNTDYANFKNGFIRFHFKTNTVRENHAYVAGNEYVLPVQSFFDRYLKKIDAQSKKFKRSLQ